MRELKNGIVGLIVSLRLMITIPVLIVSSVLMFLEYVILAFAGLFVALAILAICRVLLDDRFDRWRARRYGEDE